MSVHSRYMLMQQWRAPCDTASVKTKRCHNLTFYTQVIITQCRTRQSTVSGTVTQPRRESLLHIELDIEILIPIFSPLTYPHICQIINRPFDNR